MPVLEASRKAFIHIPRTGGSAVSHALGLPHEAGLQHVTACSYARTHPGYRLFSVVRHPLHRLLSIFRYTQPAMEHARAHDFDAWLERQLDAYRPIMFEALKHRTEDLYATRCELGSPFWFAPQAAWLCGDDDVLTVDELYATENLEQLFDAYQVHGRREHATYGSLSAGDLSAHALDLIRRFFEDDIALWERVSGSRFSDSDDALALNPTLRVQLSVEWNVRGDFKHVRRVDPHRDRELAEFLFRLLCTRDETDLDVSPALELTLRKMGLVVPTRDLPTDCRLDLALPDPTADATPDESGNDFVVNELCTPPGRSLPPSIASRIVWSDDLPDATQLLWVDDPGTGILAPYSTASETGRWAQALLEGAAVSEVPDAHRDVLVASRVLVRPGDNGHRAARWQRQCAAQRLRWQTERYAILRDLLNPVQLKLFASYLRGMERAWQLRPDGQDEGRLVRHREPLCEFVHGQVRDVVGRVLGEAVKSSYSYLTLYLPGNRLRRHRDRPQCQWNVSLVLDSTPSSDEAHAWPIYIETDRVHEVRLGAGDAVLYSGVEADHWRDPQPELQTSLVALLHFVPEGFTGSLD